MKKKNCNLTRRKADELIALLLERIEQVNLDPQYIYGVSRAVVFGSYLTDKERLGDLDIAIELGPKYRDENEHQKQYDEQVDREGKGSFLQRYFWPHEKVMRALRGRNYGISIHSCTEYDSLVEEGLATGRELYRNTEFDSPRMTMKAGGAE